MRFRAPLLLTTLTTLGCGSAAVTPPNESAPVEPAPVEPAPIESAPNPPAHYVNGSSLEVHEWGLIDVYSDGQIEIAAGPGSASSRPTPTPAYRPPMPMRKPVVYFHLDPTVDHLDVQVDVRIAGAMLETWPTPTTQVGLDHIAWQGTVAHCAAGAFSAAKDGAIQASRRGCATSDGVCEVADLPTYETSDGDCVSVGAQQGRLLFYRGELAPGIALPLTVTQTMRAEPGLPAITVSSVMRITSPLAHPVFFLAEEGGSILQPQLGDTTLPPCRDGTNPDLQPTDSLIQPFTAALVDAGLSADEARAFMAAWSDAIFGEEANRRRGPSRDARATPTLEGTLLYVLPREDIERLAPMQVSPTPRRLERVMIVRSHIAI